MKRIALLLLAGVTVISFYACNGSEDKKAKQAAADSTKRETAQQAVATDSCAGAWNITVEESEAKAMIKHYAKMFKKKGTSGEVKNLSESVWIDELVIRSLATFLESPKGAAFDGVRFVNGAPAGNNETILFIVPTKPGAGAYKHTEIWGDGVFSLLEPTFPKFQYFNRKYNEYAKERIDRFEKGYRDPTGDPAKYIDSLSTKVWMKRCVLTELLKIIEDRANQVDGITVWFGAYKDKSRGVVGQKYDTQSTIIIVPTSSDGTGGHTDRWDIIKSRPRVMDAGYNHGSLCPQVCD